MDNVENIDINFNTLHQLLQKSKKSREIKKIFERNDTYQLFTELDLNNQLLITNYIFSLKSKDNLNKYIIYLAKKIKETDISIKDLDSITGIMEKDSKKELLLLFYIKFNYSELLPIHQEQLFKLVKRGRKKYKDYDKEYVIALLSIPVDYFDKKGILKLRRRNNIIQTDFWIYNQHKRKLQNGEQQIESNETLGGYFNDVAYPIERIDRDIHKMNILATPKLKNEYGILKEVTIESINADGNCLFNAIFNYSDIVKNHIQGLDKNITNGAKLRKYIVKILKDKKSNAYKEAKKICDFGNIDIKNVIKDLKQDKKYNSLYMDVSPNIAGLILGVNINIYNNNFLPQKHKYTDNSELEVSLRLAGLHYDIVRINDNFNKNELYEQHISENEIDSSNGTDKKLIENTNANYVSSSNKANKLFEKSKSFPEFKTDALKSKTLSKLPTFSRT